MKRPPYFFLLLLMLLLLIARRPATVCSEPDLHADTLWYLGQSIINSCVFSTPVDCCRLASRVAYWIGGSGVDTLTAYTSCGELF